MNMLLRPMTEQIKNCYEKGIRWINETTRLEEVTKVRCPFLTGDAPCRADIQNIQGHMGRYGCNICETKTKRCKKVNEAEEDKRKKKKKGCGYSLIAKSKI